MKKKLMISLASILVMAGVAGLWGHKYFLGEDKNLRSQLQEEFSEAFFYFEETDLEDRASEGEDVREVHNQDEEKVDTFTEISSSSEREGRKNVQATQEAIADKYIARLQRLEATAIARIDTLFQSAYTEYNEQKARNQVNKTQLARKYLQAAAMLEESVEGKFNEILKEMETELLKYQLSTNLVKEARNEYNKAVRKKKTSMFSKLEGLI